MFNIGYYIVFTFLPTYFIRTLGFSKSDAFLSITLACLVALILILPLAALSDRIGRRPLLIGGAAAIESVYISCAVSAGVEMFATRVRFSGFSVGYNVCVALFGGTTPYVVTWLTANTGNSIAPAWYLVGAAVISLAAVVTLRETAGRPLAQVQYNRADEVPGVALRQHRDR